MAVSKRISPPREYTTVADVVHSGLCHSCGVCSAVCPRDIISFDDQALPLVEEKRCNRCGLCVQICSGWQGHYQVSPDENDQRSTSYYLAATKDEKLRIDSSSGGLVTELLRYLLDKGTIGRALVTVAHPGNPGRPVSILAASDEELIASCQSRYALFPWGKAVKELMLSDQPWAAVGTSCQLSSLANCLELFPKLQRNLVVMIGICCESNVEPQATDHLLRLRQIPRHDVERIEYRSGLWPGVMSAFLASGEEVVLSNRNRLEGAINYLKLCYGRDRCKFCPDILCESADIVVGDPWGRDSQGKLIYRGSEGYSAAIVRSSKVADMLEEMVAAGRIDLQEDPTGSILRVQLRQQKDGELKVMREVGSAYSKGRPYPLHITSDPESCPVLGHRQRLVRSAVSLAKGKWAAEIVMGLMFSKVGDYLTQLNSRRKRSKAARKS